MAGRSIVSEQTLDAEDDPFRLTLPQEDFEYLMGKQQPHAAGGAGD